MNEVGSVQNRGGLLVGALHRTQEKLCYPNLRCQELSAEHVKNIIMASFIMSCLIKWNED